MSADVVIANFLRLASQDLEAAKLLAAPRNRNAVYQCEQAAEKVIRAVLTSEGVHAGIKHKLDEMVDMVPDLNPIKPRLRAIEHLAAFATTFRYPSPVGKIKAAPSPTDLATYIANVEAALKDAATRFGVDLEKPNAPAARPGPFR
jgi:HEPN domain-containing protein